MTGSVPVFVYADDPALDRAVVHALAQEDGIAAVRSADQASWLVAATSMMPSGDNHGAQRVVGLVTCAEDTGVCGVLGAVVSAMATATRPGGGSPTLTPGCLTAVAQALLRSGGKPSPLTPREEAVLRLVAEGRSTAEIAAAVAYSERSVKNVIQAVTERLALRNRCHAVAHAVRSGWI